eukprot:584068-Prymnesium_polylepis.1
MPHVPCAAGDHPQRGRRGARQVPAVGRCDHRIDRGAAHQVGVARGQAGRRGAQRRRLADVRHAAAARHEQRQAVVRWPRALLREAGARMARQGRGAGWARAADGRRVGFATGTQGRAGGVTSGRVHFGGMIERMVLAHGAKSLARFTGAWFLRGAARWLCIWEVAHAGERGSQLGAFLHEVARSRFGLL